MTTLCVERPRLFVGLVLVEVYGPCFVRRCDHAGLGRRQQAQESCVRRVGRAGVNHWLVVVSDVSLWRQHILSGTQHVVAFRSIPIGGGVVVVKGGQALHRPPSPDLRGRRSIAS